MTPPRRSRYRRGSQGPGGGSPCGPGVAISPSPVLVVVDDQALAPFGHDVPATRRRAGNGCRASSLTARPSGCAEGLGRVVPEVDGPRLDLQQLHGPANDQVQEGRERQFPGDLLADDAQGLELAGAGGQRGLGAVALGAEGLLGQGLLDRGAEADQAVLEEVVAGPQPQALQGDRLAHGAGDDDDGEVPAPRAHGLEGLAGGEGRQGVIGEDEVEGGLEVGEVVRLGLHPLPRGGVPGRAQVLNHHRGVRGTVLQDEDAEWRRHRRALPFVLAGSGCQTDAVRAVFLGFVSAAPPPTCRRHLPGANRSANSRLPGRNVKANRVKGANCPRGLTVSRRLHSAPRGRPRNGPGPQASWRPPSNRRSVSRKARVSRGFVR